MDKTFDNLPDIGSQIKKWRSHKNMTQEDLARRADISLSTIAKVETDEINDPRLETIVSIADALGISLDQLVRRDPPSKADFKGGLIRE